MLMSIFIVPILFLSIAFASKYRTDQLQIKWKFVILNKSITLTNVKDKIDELRIYFLLTLGFHFISK